MNKRITPFNKLPISTKITLLYTGVFIIAVTFISIFIMGNLVLYNRAASKSEMEQTAKKIAEYISLGGEINEEKIKELNPNKFVQVRIIDEDKNKVFEIATIAPMPPKNYARANSSSADNFKVNSFRKDKFMFYDMNVSYQDKQYTINLFRIYNLETEFRQRLMSLFIFSNIVGIIISLFVARYISKTMIRPIQTIRKTAERISIEDLSQRIAYEGPDDELKELVVTFNEMIGRLEVSFNKQNQFISDASHELRTPISVIQGYANLISRWGKSDPDILEESIDNIKSETEHMTKLIKKLLFLAKDEQNKKHIQKKPLLLNQVATEVLREIEILESEIKVNLVDDAPVLIFGDFDLIKQLMWIFIENGMKYTKDKNTEITVKLHSDGKNSYLTISDQGIGIPEEEIPYIFNRFYRVDKSRNQEISGTGLGLSIAQWIVKQHNGKIMVNSKENEGTEMMVVFDCYGE